MVLQRMIDRTLVEDGTWRKINLQHPVLNFFEDTWSPHATSTKGLQNDFPLRRAILRSVQSFEQCGSHLRDLVVPRAPRLVVLPISSRVCVCVSKL